MDIPNLLANRNLRLEHTAHSNIDRVYLEGNSCLQAVDSHFPFVCNFRHCTEFCQIDFKRSRREEHTRNILRRTIHRHTGIKVKCLSFDSEIDIFGDQWSKTDSMDKETCDSHRDHFGIYKDFRVDKMAHSTQSCSYLPFNS